jgi:O-antigen ligase
MASSTAFPTRRRANRGPASQAARPCATAPAIGVPGTSLGFALFVLANAILFVRPSDVFPSLEGVEIYRYLLVGCLAVSFPAVLHYLGKGELTSRPIDLCVFALFPFVILSSQAAGGFDIACENAIIFFKIIVYYLLLVSLVTTPWRMRAFTGWLILFAAVVTILAALDFFKVIAIPRGVLENGRTGTVDPDRMYGPAIFQDPNDICALIVVCMILLIGRLADRRGGLARWLWLLPLAVFLFGFYLTRSRGGLLALAAGLAIAVRVRYGWQRVFLLGILGLPLLALLGARQLDISTTTNTGQERIQLWSDGLVMFRANPLFGVGPDGFRDQAGHVAHHSYLQSFSELGFGGGMFFLGAAALAFLGMYRLSRPLATSRGIASPQIVDADLHQLYPYMLGAVTAYTAGMLTLTLNMLVTTYTFLGLGGLFLSITTTRPVVPRDRFDATLLVRLAGLGVLFLGGMFVFVRLTFRP